MSWRSRGWGLAGVALIVATGCAAGDTDEEYDGSSAFDAAPPRDGTVTHKDGGNPPTVDGGGDSGQPEAASGPDAGDDAADGSQVPADTGGDGGGCSPGFHLCGSTCTANGLNSPNTGCALTCGTACSPPDGGTSTCSDAGTCGFECDMGLMPVGNGCSGSGTCNTQCCSNNDCAAAGFQNTTCTGGTCSGCEPNFGDCDGDPTNGCETSLDNYFDCGACSNKCDGDIFACGFLAGGQSCESDDMGGYACGC